MPLPVNKTNSRLVAAAISQILKDGSTGVLATLIDGPTTSGDVGAKLLIPDDISTAVGGLGNSQLNEAVVRHAGSFLKSSDETRVDHVREFAPELAEFADAQILFERIHREPRLVICGAGYVGALLAKLSALMGYRATLIDDRVEFLKRELFPDPRIDLLVAESWAQAVRDAVGDGRSVSVAIVTRGHSEDEQCLRAIIDSNPDYIGLIGSKRRTNIVLARLVDGGADRAKVAKVHAPIGLDIGAVTPEEVALAIMAEIVAVRRGGSGESLSTWRRREP
jgi:xanthine dehydrogenase accessory factor